MVFCSKDYRPILVDLPKITTRFNTYFHYTITAYGKDIEPGVQTIEKSIETLKQLSAQVGKQRLAWRYDPVLLTRKYTVGYHLETFDKMTKAIAPYVDRCIFSFVEMYKKLAVNMPELIPLTENDKHQLAREMGNIARKYGLYLQTCGTDGDFSSYGIHTSGCMTLDILGNANAVNFRTLKHKGSRQGCHCVEARDIGAYDSCTSGCKYCYANKSPEKARQMQHLHDPNSPLLLGHIQPDDVILQSNQRSFLAPKQFDLIEMWQVA